MAKKDFDPFAYMDARVRGEFDNWYNAVSSTAIDRCAAAKGFLAGWNRCVQAASYAVGMLDPDEHPIGDAALPQTEDKKS